MPTRLSPDQHVLPPISQRPIPGLSTRIIRTNTPDKVRGQQRSSIAHESVTQRLHRLRFENKRQDANNSARQPHREPRTRPRSHDSQINPTHDFIISYFISVDPSSLSPLRHPSHPTGQLPVPSHSVDAGPPPPASWLPTPSAPPDLSLPVSLPPSGLLTPRPPSLILRQIILQRSSRHPPSEVSSLFDCCLRRMAYDISSMGTGESLPTILELSEKDKSRLLELAAEWSPLDDHSFISLFPPLLSDDRDHHPISESWEAEPEADRMIRVLDLSFSSVHLRSLSGILFTHGTLSAPWLTTLRLDHPSHIILSTSLLQLLSALPLLELSLAAQRLDPSLLPTNVLPRLASSTPSLRTLDLSFNFDWAGLPDDPSKPDGFSRELGLGTIAWEHRWANLDRLILMGNLRSVGSQRCSRALTNLFKVLKDPSWVTHFISCNVTAASASGPLRASTMGDFSC